MDLRGTKPAVHTGDIGVSHFSLCLGGPVQEGGRHTNQLYSNEVSVAKREVAQRRLGGGISRKLSPERLPGYGNLGAGFC